LAFVCPRPLTSFFPVPVTYDEATEYLRVSRNEKLLDLYKFGQNRYLQCAVLVARVEKNEEFTQKFYRGTKWKAEDMEGQHVSSW